MNRGSARVTAEDLNMEHISKEVKILGIHFTHDYALFYRLNLDSIIKSLKKSLNSGSWRGLTLLGKIQIIKTFAIPKILYRMSLVCLNKNFINDINQILFNFIWKGKDKVKRVTLINDVNEGGLKMPHIDSMIEAQRIMCIQKFLDNTPCSWKCILTHYRNKVGGRLLFYCNLEYSKLAIDIPKYYKECLIAWSLLKNSNPYSLDEIVNQLIWNNRFICIDNRSVFNRKLFSLGLCKVGDLCEFICTKPHITESLLNVLDLFYLKSLYHSLPPDWKKEVNSNVTQATNKTITFNMTAQADLSSKKIYNLLISKISRPPTAKKKFENQYASGTNILDWETIYTLPFKCALEMLKPLLERSHRCHHDDDVSSSVYVVHPRTDGSG